MRRDRRPLTADHGRTGFPDCREGRPSTNGKTNQRMQTADGRPWQDRLSALSGRQTVNEWGTNQRIQTARTVDRVRTGFPACREGRPSTNGKTNQRMQTADGRPRQDRLSGLSGRQTVNEWGTNQRIQTARTADHGRTGFPACREGKCCCSSGGVVLSHFQVGEDKTLASYSLARAKRNGMAKHRAGEAKCVKFAALSTRIHRSRQVLEE